MLYPLKFKPILKEKIWGGRRLGEKLGKRLPAGRAVGESWELSGLDGNRSVVRNGPLKGNDLEELIEESGISKNKLSHRAEMQRTQVNSYCNGTITRLDIAVLARLCTVLECDISDLLEYIPPEIGEEGNE